MWRTLDENSTGLSVHSVGELKSALKNVPDDYEVYVGGVLGGLLVNDEVKSVLIDDSSYLEGIVGEREPDEEVEE